MTRKSKSSRGSGAYGSHYRNNAPAQREINILDQKLDTLVNNLFHFKAPAVLFHYTNWEGATGILMNRQFWHTDHACTNDPAELTTADQIIIEVAAQLKQTVNGLAHNMLDLFLISYPQMRISQIAPVFITCFSKASDNPKQWLKYADHGKGVCLGINILTEPILTNDRLGRLLAPVDYSEDSWREKVKTIFKAISTEFSGIATTNNTALELGLNALFRIATYAAVTAKKQKWASEEEWRHIVIPQRDMSINPCERQGPFGTIRYLPVFMRQNRRPVALAEIIIGSNQNIDQAQARLMKLLKSAGYPHEFANLPEISVGIGIGQQE